jgi:hypothetical protein
MTLKPPASTSTVSPAPTITGLVSVTVQSRPYCTVPPPATAALRLASSHVVRVVAGAPTAVDVARATVA